MKNNEIEFKPDRYGYMVSNIGNYVLTYGARLKPEAPFYIGVQFRHTILNSNWLNVFSENEAKKNVIQEYKRCIKLFGKKEPINKDGYSLLKLNVERNENGKAICCECKRPI